VSELSAGGKMISESSISADALKYKDIIHVLSEEDYYNFIFNEYIPSEYESNELNDKRFIKGTYYSHVCRTRCFLIYREIVNRLSENSNILDIGLFPGTIVRQLKSYWAAKFVVMESDRK
jgi:hypothetical protein